jgi:hypothetical protein
MGINDRVGLGFYPQWLPGTQGFHLDNRGWKIGKRPAESGLFWVRLDRPQWGFKTGYHYNEVGEKIVKKIKEVGFK